MPHTLGNGGDWYKNSPESQRSATPKAGDAAVRPTSSSDAYGHVAYVESVNSDGTITVSEYNHDAKGDGDMRTGKAADMGFTEFVDFGVHPETSSSPSSPPRISAVQYNNELSVFKRGGDKAIWKNTWQPANNAWTGWSSLEGILAGDPIAMQYNNEMIVWGTNYASTTDKNTWNGAQWSGFTALP